ncbi:MAG TPA: CotH kinase family protein [Kiritimatiellia bacterium]|nr:CotH kinase family protein [Kiritimatiellia bacterium]HRU69609.1 CotH kinase family protein [Kiritimatiellia bacterium]
MNTPTSNTCHHIRLWGLTVLAFAMCMGTRGTLVINEVCYDNSTVPDENGDTSSDWIELYNTGPSAVNVLNYGLGDANPYEEAKGVRLPNYTIPPGGFLVVFANTDLPEYTAWTGAPDIEAIPANTVWRYSAPASAPASTWKDTTFNDASWPSGIAPLGYNDATLNMDCATILPYGSNPANRYPTAYFRKTFKIVNPSVVTGLVVRARINDGMVLYLNGTEQKRVYMPDGAISHSTLATMSVPSTLWTNFLISASGLVAGNNVLAVEVHQAAAGSVDLIMDMTVTALVQEQVPVVHGQFGLSKTGDEHVHLFDNTLTRIHRFDAPSSEPGENKSCGLATDGVTGIYKVYDRPTPGLPNATYAQKYAVTLHDQKPTFSVAPGFYAGNQTVVLNTATPGYNVYYTLDGSDPRESTTFVFSGNPVTLNAAEPATSGLAWLRTNPVEIGARVPGAAWLPPVDGVPRAVMLRAIAVQGSQCSPETRGTYFIGPSFTSRTLPAVSITADADNLFGFTSGIYVPGKCYADSPEGYGDNKWGKPYANYHQDNDNQTWERPVQAEFFEPAQNTAAFSLALGMAMHGGGTRAIPQKTLYLMARLGEYGTDYINHPLFPDESATRYKRFLLRNSGNDWYGPMSGGIATMLKDAVFHRIVKGLNTSVMAYRPVTAYINGEYWGIHNLRESFDKHYLATRYGLDPDNVDMLMHEEDEDNTDKVQITRIDGDKNSDEEYEDLIDWIKDNPLSGTVNYQRVQTAAVFTNALGIVITGIDVTNHADYIIAETFFANTDWPINNCDFWRAHTNQTATCGAFGDTRWRWMLYDLDVAGEKGADFNMFTYLSSSKMTGGSEPGFLINQLWANWEFRNYFVTRYANLLNTTFRPERMAAIITEAADAIAPEIERHFNRWGRAFTQAQWRTAVTHVLIAYTATRHAVSWQHLDAHFGLGGTGTLTVKNLDPAGTGGRFIVNGIPITTDTEGVTTRAAWSGTFFRSLPVTVQAVPDDGYAFDGWAGTAVMNPSPSLFVGDTPIILTARFRPLAAPAYQPTGYEQWQLANYLEQQILGDGTAAPDAPSGYAGMSNFALYAFGMSRYDGLTDEQRIARARLSIHAQDNALWLGYTRLNGSFDDVRYRLKVADSLTAPINWIDAATGIHLDPVALTNTLDASTWFFEVRLPQATPERDKRFFKLEAEQK